MQLSLPCNKMCNSILLFTAVFASFNNVLHNRWHTFLATFICLENCSFISQVANTTSSAFKSSHRSMSPTKNFSDITTIIPYIFVNKYSKQTRKHNIFLLASWSMLNHLYAFYLFLPRTYTDLNRIQAPTFSICANPAHIHVITWFLYINKSAIIFLSDMHTGPFLIILENIPIL